MADSSDQCAREIIEVIPLVMRVIRSEVQRSRFPELSLPEFRSLAFLGRNRGATLGEVASHLGMAPPSASKLVDGLVLGELVTREIPAGDRRRINLTLTPAGQSRYQVAYDTAVELLDARLSEVPDGVKSRIVESMHALRAAFGESPTLGTRVASRPRHVAQSELKVFPSTETPLAHA